jgi:hypothetical protein
MKYKVGDIVIGNAESCGNIRGKKGKIIYVHHKSSMENYLIEFFDIISEGHDGNSNLVSGKDGHCWWVSDHTIALVEAEKPKLFGIAQFVNNINQGIYR